MKRKSFKTKTENLHNFDMMFKNNKLHLSQSIDSNIYSGRRTDKTNSEKPLMSFEAQFKSNRIDIPLIMDDFIKTNKEADKEIFESKENKEQTEEELLSAFESQFKNNRMSGMNTKIYSNNEVIKNLDCKIEIPLKGLETQNDDNVEGESNRSGYKSKTVKSPKSLFFEDKALVKKIVSSSNIDKKDNLENLDLDNKPSEQQSPSKNKRKSNLKVEFNNKEDIILLEDKLDLNTEIIKGILKLTKLNLFL